MKNKSVIIVLIIIVLVGGYLLFNKNPKGGQTVENNQPATTSTTTNVSVADFKNLTYKINGEEVKLNNGEASEEAAPGSASKITTSYFGNELVADLDGDGEKDDVAFILTQNTGGSGTFYYAVAALKTANGEVGSDGYLLGDRIAPQSTELSQNPNQKNVVVFNYADRAPNEAMSVEPSVGKSVYLKIDPATMQWGVVEPNFSGEAR